jgi:dynactin 1
MRRTIANYRTTVETLKMEKQTLIDLQEGGEGKQKSLIASSQKALAKAAQMVADAAALRKREAKAVMDKIDQQIYRQLSTRLETLLPHSAVGAEVAAIKGELLTAKVVSKASQSLAAITTSFTRSIRPPIPSEQKTAIGIVAVSDQVKAEVATMFHQTEYALDIVNVSSGLIRYLAAGQWPDLLSPEVSSELGALLSHSMLDLDLVLGNVLQSMKEEGALIAEQSNIERLRQATKNTFHQLETDLDREEGPLVPTDWNPPGLNLLKEVSLSKFSCMGAAAMLSSVINAEDSTEAASLNEIYNKVEQCGVQASSACLRFSNMNITGESMVSNFANLVSSVTKDSSLLLQSVQEVIIAGGDVNTCEAAVDSALRSLTQLSAALRAANLNPTEEGSFHPLSPEADDVWDRLSALFKTVREIDGDGEDVNYLIRSRQIESSLTTAVENEPKLHNAESKIANLEKVRLQNDIGSVFYKSYSLQAQSFRTYPPGLRSLPCKMLVCRNLNEC